MPKYAANVGAFAKGDHVWVVVETPSGSRWKYTWDPDAQAYRAGKLLPVGLSFPYEFGFVPRTKADDGDPLDALVISDAPLAVGALVECRVLGAYEIKQSDKADDEPVRNDRLVVVPKESHRGAEWKTLSDLGHELVKELGDFLASYVEREGRKFELLRTVQHDAALRLVKAAEQ